MAKMSDEDAERAAWVIWLSHHRSPHVTIEAFLDGFRAGLVNARSRQAERLEALGFDTPYPVTDVLAQLADAAEHLLKDHSCDALGHEGIRDAMLAARRICEALDRPQADAAEGEDEGAGLAHGRSGQTKQLYAFVRAILHGDSAHRAWLLLAADSFLRGDPIAPVQGGGGREMAYWRCLGCNFMTGDFGLACKHRCGASGRWERCTCGSGAHPRRCELHPDVYARHVALLNDKKDDHD